MGRVRVWFLGVGALRKRYNERKREVLSVFEGRGWLSTKMAQALSGYPWRSFAWYLDRLYRWRLLLRRGGYRSRIILYKLSARGRDRLAWLRSGRSMGRSGR